MLIAVVNGEERLYSQKLACTECGASVPQLEPRSFSFNSPYGACEECTGLGSKWTFDPGKAIVDFSRPLLEGGLGPGAGSAYMRHRLAEAAKALRIDLGTPFDQFPKKVQSALLEGSNGFPGILESTLGADLRRVLRQGAPTIASGSQSICRRPSVPRVRVSGCGPPAWPSA